MENLSLIETEVNMQIGIGIFLIILGLFIFTIGILNKIETPIRGYCFLNIRKGSIIEAISINGAEEKILVYRAPAD